MKIMLNDAGIDENGYPTEELLEKISKLNPFEHDIGGIIEFLEVNWMNGNGYYFRYDEEKGCLEMGTGGWSGCESMIHALQKSAFWVLYWYQTRCGGHHWFRIKPLKKQ